MTEEPLVCDLCHKVITGSYTQTLKASGRVHETRCTPCDTKKGLRTALSQFPKMSTIVPPGTVYLCSEPECVGRMPVRSEIEIEPGPPPCWGEKELAEFGSVAVRRVVGGQPPTDNTIGPEWILAVGGTVLVRAAEFGFYMVPLEKDTKGWFTTCGSERVDVTWSEKRQCWVHTKLPGRKN